MNFKKIFVTLLLILTTAFALASCGDDYKSKQPKPDDSMESIPQDNIKYESFSNVDNYNDYSNNAEIIKTETESIIKIYHMATSGSIRPIVDKIGIVNGELKIHITSKIDSDEEGTCDIEYWNISITNPLSYVDGIENIIVEVN